VQYRDLTLFTNTGKKIYRISRKTNTQRNALPALSPVTGVEQNSWLANDPTLLAIEADAV
jgi:hypothetical protein